MRIVVVAGRVARWPWSPGGIVRDLCLGLARAGHDVRLIAHSVDDADALGRIGAPAAPAEPISGSVAVRTIEPYVDHHTHWPESPRVRRALLRLVDEQVDAGARVVIGTTHLLGPAWRDQWAGRVRAAWLPVEPTAPVWLRTMWRTRWRGWNLGAWRSALAISAAMARHRGVVPAALRHRLLARHRSAALLEAGRASAGARGVIPLDPGGYAPTMAHAKPEPRRSSATPSRPRPDASPASRHALSIGPGRFAMLVSCPASPPMGLGGGLVGLLRACARMNERVRAGDFGPAARTPLLILLTTQPFLVHQEELDARILGTEWIAEAPEADNPNAADLGREDRPRDQSGAAPGGQRAGGQRAGGQWAGGQWGGGGVRLLGVTHRMSAALAAADAVVLLPTLGDRSAATRLVMPAGVHGRLACDALAAGKPLIGASARLANPALAPLRNAIEASCFFADDRELRGDAGAQAWCGVLERAIVADAHGRLGLPEDLAQAARERVGLHAWIERILESIRTPDQTMTQVGACPG